MRAATAGAMKGHAVESISGASQGARALAGEELRLAGRVKFFDAAKRHGYIAADGGKDYFFNSNGFRGEAPRKGDRVEFAPARGPKGLMAKQLQILANA